MGDRSNTSTDKSVSPSRRNFLAASGTLVAGASLAKQAMAIAPHTFGEDVIKVGLVGCGGRGKSALGQIISTPGPVKVVALADAFEYRIEEALQSSVAAAERKAEHEGGEVVRPQIFEPLRLPELRHLDDHRNREAEPGRTGRVEPEHQSQAEHHGRGPERVAGMLLNERR